MMSGFNVDKQEVINAINQIEDAKAWINRDGFSVLVKGFRNYYVPFINNLYNKDCLPPLPPLEKGYKWTNQAISTWNRVIKIINDNMNNDLNKGYDY